MNALTLPVTDGWTIARRNTLKIRRSPDLLVGAVMLPIVLVLLFSYAFSWVTATVALALHTPESFNGIANMVALPLVFVSSAFLDSSGLPTPLRVVAEWNPVSTFAQAARELFGNTSTALQTSDAWPMQNAVPASLLWIAVMLAVFIPLATRLYKKAVSA